MITDQFRQKAIDWLKGKRNFSEGLAILSSSGFKPGVVRRLQQLGETPENILHLKENIYLYLKCIGTEVEDTDADLGVINGKQTEVLEQNDQKNCSIDQLEEKIANGEASAPSNATKLIREYAYCYREREKAHRLMSDIHEDNSDDNVEARKVLSDAIDEFTSRMERIYPLIAAYLETNTDPGDEDTANALFVEKNTVEEKVESDNAETGYDSLSKEELQKLLKSAKTKILRKTNLLEYQQETKKAEKDPLPDCPKRVKYETEIEKLKAEVEALQYAIARKG